MRTRYVLSAVISALLGFVAPGADDFSSLGYREDTVIESDGRDDCIGTFICNHDYSFENAYCWQLGGLYPPYYGAIAEGYDLGPATIECGVFWFTQIAYMYPAPTDIYIWSGGVDAPPSEVLCLIPDVSDFHIGLWPTCSENEVLINECVDSDFAVGYWQPLWGGACPFYCCADENGPGGHPWTCIAPGIGYPSGWQHPNVVWPNCKSMGIGATIIETPSPAESRTWGAIKSLFR